MNDERKSLERELYRLRLERIGINVRIREVKRSIHKLVRPVKSKTHCAHGHEFTPDNLIMKLNKDGITRYPACLTCRREQGRRARKKNPEAALEATRRWRARKKNA